MERTPGPPDHGSKRDRCRIGPAWRLRGVGAAPPERAGSAHSSGGCQEASVFAVGHDRETRSLEEQGLIQRVPDTEDRRAVRLRVTDSGRRLIDEAFGSSLDVYESILDELSPAEREQVATLLTKLLKRLDHLAKSK